MMATKKRGVLAKPGEYRFGDVTEVKTAEELKQAVERQPILTLTLGHPVGGTVRASDYIGTVTQKWNEEKQRVDGDFWFYDEYLPDHIRERIVNDMPVSISAGYTVDSVEDGVQKGILYSHVAVLDGEDPKCPLHECGVNVRMESSDPMRYEQEQDITEPKESVSEEKQEESPKPSVTFTAEQFTEFLEVIKSFAPALPAEQKPEVEEPEAEQPEATPEPPTQEPKVEPEVVIPAERPDTGKRLEPKAEGFQFLGEEIK
jgi:hypothetical protein